MKRPRISLMVMPEGEPDRPVRSYSLPGYLPRLAVGVGLAVAVLLIAGWALAIIYGKTARRAASLEAENTNLRRMVRKVDRLETELAFHRDFTRRVAGLIGVSVPDFADSARAMLAASRDSAPATVAAPQPTAAGETIVPGPESKSPGVLVTECAADPNNRPRGLPLLGHISQGFTPRASNPVLRHEGIDLAVREGAPVLATADGVVAYAGPDDLYGFLVVLDHQNGFTTIYGHNSVVLVRTGDVVHRGDRIAFSGNTGLSTAPHLHYQIMEDGRPVDPTGFLGP